MVSKQKQTRRQAQWHSSGQLSLFSQGSQLSGKGAQTLHRLSFNLPNALYFILSLLLHKEMQQVLPTRSQNTHLSSFPGPSSCRFHSPLQGLRRAGSRQPSPNVGQPGRRSWCGPAPSAVSHKSGRGTQSDSDLQSAPRGKAASKTEEKTCPAPSWGRLPLLWRDTDPSSVTNHDSDSPQ